MDMGDGARSVRSAKYELPIFNKTNKTEYAIGCVHLTTLTEETLSSEQSQRLIYNRSIKGIISMKIRIILYCFECRDMLRLWYY